MTDRDNPMIGPETISVTNCPTCGGLVRVVSGDEGTSHYEPVGGLGGVWAEVAEELARAQRQHGPMHSGHEAVGVIEEEFLEFQEAVFWGVDRRGNPADPRYEAVQLAAMAVRYLLDVKP